MMTCHVGSRGIGKTYHLTKELYNDYHKQGAMVITNFYTPFSDYVLNGKDEILEAISEIRIFKESGFQPCDIDPKFKSCTIAFAIDEAHLIFQDNKKYKDLLPTMAEARKMQVDLHLTTQSVGKLDKDLRRYIEPYVFYVPLLGMKRYVRIPGFSKKDPSIPLFKREMRYILPIFQRQECAMEADNTAHASKEILSTTLTTSGWISPKYYKMYDSNELISHHGTRGIEDFKFNIFKVKDDFQALPTPTNKPAS